MTRMATVRPRSTSEGTVRARRLSEGQIRALSVSVRLKLCRGASQDLRKIMIRDPNPSIAVAVLEFNSLADSEVETIAGNKNMASEVLGQILRDRRWPQKRAIALALVKNPKSAGGICDPPVERPVGSRAGQRRKGPRSFRDCPEAGQTIV